MWVYASTPETGCAVPTGPTRIQKPSSESVYLQGRVILCMKRGMQRIYWTFIYMILTQTLSCQKDQALFSVK